MKKTFAILGLVAFSNAANHHLTNEQLLKLDTKTEVANFAHMPGKITPIIKADSDNELHNYIQLRSHEGNVQINDYKSHDDADNELHNYYMPNNKRNVQVNDYKSHDDSDNEFYHAIPIDQKPSRDEILFISHFLSLYTKDKKDNAKDFLPLE